MKTTLSVNFNSLTTFTTVSTSVAPGTNSLNGISIGLGTSLTFFLYDPPLLKNLLRTLSTSVAFT